MRCWLPFIGLALVGCGPDGGDSKTADIARSTTASYLVYVTNERSGDVSIVDAEAGREIGRIVIGKRPRGLIASPDGKTLYVAVSGSPIGGPGIDTSKLPPPDKAADGIAVIDLASRKFVRTLRGISDPEQIAISPDGQLLYVASEDSGRLLVIGIDGRVRASLAVGGEPEGVAVSPDGSTILATSEEDNSVAVIGGNPLAVLKRINVGERPRNALFLDAGRAAVPGELDASLSIVDIARRERVATFSFPEEDRPMGLAKLDANTILVTTGRGGRLVRLDLSSKDQAVTGSVEVGPRPWGLTLAPDRRRAFVANGPSDDVTIVDPATMKIVGRVKTGQGPWGALAVSKPAF